MALLIAHHYDFLSPQIDTGEDSGIEPYGTIWMDHAAFNISDFGFSISEIASARDWTLTDAGDGVLIIDLEES